MNDVLCQAGAIPFRVEGRGLRVLLITSRDTGRWVIPKGGLIRGTRPHRPQKLKLLRRLVSKENSTRRRLASTHMESAYGPGLFSPHLSRFMRLNLKNSSKNGRNVQSVDLNGWMFPLQWQRWKSKG